jgi:ABC-2 type transport system permease protein
MGMNWRPIFAIVRRDLKVVSQSKPVVIPLIVVPVLMLVAIPALAALAPQVINVPGASANDMEQMLRQIAPGLRAQLEGYDVAQQAIILFIMYFLAPMYLIVPLMVASVVAADSFAGEKERKTLESLLYTPTDDRELLVAKLLSAWLPAVAIGLIGFVLYGLVANIAAWPTMGRVYFPNLMWIVLALWVAPAVAGLGLGSTVLVSARVSTFQEAYQMGAIVVLPVIALVGGQALGVMYLSVEFVVLLGAIVWAIDAVLLWLGARSFTRSALIARI